MLYNFYVIVRKFIRNIQQKITKTRGFSRLLFTAPWWTKFGTCFRFGDYPAVCVCAVIVFMNSLPVVSSKWDRLHPVGYLPAHIGFISACFHNRLSVD